MTLKGRNRQKLLPPITAERLRELLRYEPATGALICIERSSVKSRAELGRAVGTVTNARGTKRVTIAGRIYALHRLVWLHVHGQWPSGCIDHINGDPGDNRIENLRDVTPQINNQNKRRSNGQTVSGLIGAHWTRAGWQASIKLGGKNNYLGRFESAAAAHEAYIAAKRRLHEGNTL